MYVTSAARVVQSKWQNSPSLVYMVRPPEILEVMSSAYDSDRYLYVT